MGVGIFLTPATLVRTLGSIERVLALWGVMGAFSICGALCYAELSTRFPQAGGMYVYLKAGFGARCAFVYGWMTLLVVDPGVTAALAIGGAQYLLASTNLPATSLTPVAIGLIVALGLLTLAGLRISAQLLQWTAFAKLAGIAALLVAAVTSSGGGSRELSSAPLSLEMLAPAIVAGFFAFGGWWDLSRLGEEVRSPRRTLPLALIASVTIVTIAYAAISLALLLTAPAGVSTLSDAELVNRAGIATFGESATQVLAAIVLIAVGGSLAAVLLGAPRLFLAMTRDRLLPQRLLGQNESRGTMTGATVIQVTLACLLVALGTFNQILGYFVPGAVFFLGLSVCTSLKLPRPKPDTDAFRIPWHPLPVLVFLALIVAMLGLFAVGQPRETLIGGLVILLGLPVSFLVSRPTT